ncbi:MAG: hypothetical protein FWC65_00075, partial [Treponema sp.]|nr:hypothetical protein [Treponema sp.]
MKKILVGLLVLAVAGGSAFAQGWTFNGLVSGGLGLFFFEDEDSDTQGRVAPINNDAANTAFRTQLDARFANESRTAGLHLRLRAQGNMPGSAAFGFDEDALADILDDIAAGNPHDELDGLLSANNNLAAWFDVAQGWLSFADNMFTIYGGRVDSGFFNSLDRMMIDDSGEGLGFLALVRPVEGLTLGFGGFANGAAGLNAMTWDDTGAQARGTFSARFDADDFRITAGLRNRSDAAAAGIGDSRGAGAVGATGAGNPSQAYLSFAWLGDTDMHAAFTARFMNLEDFGDIGDMRFYATFAHTGLVENMGLHLGASFGMTMYETASGVADPVPHIWAWFAIDYAVTNSVVPRLDVHYVMGGRWNGMQRLHNWSIRDGATFHEDDSFINIRPSVQFRVTPAAFLELGGIFNIDLGEDTRTAAWGYGHGTN